MYAIERNEDAYRRANDLINNLGLTDRIILIHGDATQVQLPERVDVCVSEILGTIGSSEGVVSLLNDARRFLKDDGIMMSGIRISDDGSTVIFIRGGGANRDGWYANPTADPNGPDHAVWAARTTGGGGTWRVADANNPELAPDGSAILFVKDAQIYRAKVTPVKP